MAYEPIENYGMIGDTHTVALVGLDGSIDWMCAPRFDSPAVFLKLLDDSKGGYFRISPVRDSGERKQYYWPDTNVLTTRFLAPGGAAELVDFMPIEAHKLREAGTRRQIVRRISGVRGCLEMEMCCLPTFDFARASHTVTQTEHGVIFESEGLRLALKSTVPIEIDGRSARARFTLEESEQAVFVLSHLAADVEGPTELDVEEADGLFRATVSYWRDWLSQCSYRGRWREMVFRSALALKLMTYSPTGAIVAAPTCSLPENIGGYRNWDYRYAWIRDSAFVVYAFLRLGFTHEAERFMHFITTICKTPDANDGPLQIMYGIHGETTLHEETLDHLDGYRGSKPVRVGNGAYDQLQLDIYGELMDAVYLYNKYGAPISYSFWLKLRAQINWVAENWQREDEGIWETRGGRKHFTYSRLMCWVALDRAVRLADKRSFPSERDRWITQRDAIMEEVMEKGWHEGRQAFVQAYESDALDASVLMMPLTFFLSPVDPKMLSTLHAIMQRPEEGGLLSNSLVFRYDPRAAPDGLEGEEGTFNICTFWLVEALTRAGRFKHHRPMLDEARLIFERMMGFANHLGLYAEETGPCGEALGNYPQAFTHLALISAAFNLDRALGDRQP